MSKTKPTKLTPELHQSICNLVAAGAPLPLACPAAGVSWNTAKEWFKPEYAEREPYASLVLGVEKAKAAHAIGCQMRITRAGKNGSWKADLAILQRRHPEFYDQRVNVALSGPDGGPIETAGTLRMTYVVEVPADEPVESD